jgi:hypothetical protein
MSADWIKSTERVIFFFYQRFGLDYRAAAPDPVPDQAAILESLARLKEEITQSKGRSAARPLGNLIDQIHAGRVDLPVFRAAEDALNDTFKPLHAKARKRRAKPRQARPLTERQAEVFAVLARHHGDVKAAARELGITRQAVAKVRRIAYAKIGTVAPKLAAPKVHALPHDRRGQAIVAAPEADDD